ncbi:MAG: efflux transporter outer membrane subunit [Gammaproteobacteria bacterium]|nr:efflux transporter outer membrane subunit [Gammaproteobacteria bacterium]
MTKLWRGLSLMRLGSGLGFLLPFLVVAGCSQVNQLTRIEQQTLLGEQFLQSGLSEQQSSDQAEPNHDKLVEWWRQFDNETINLLVSQALKQNYDLKVAAANVLESQALLDSAFAGFWPFLDLSYSPRRNFISTATRFTGNGAGGFINNGSSGKFSSRHAVTLSLSWQLDLFGRLRHGYSAAQADLNALEQDRVALTQTLIANVLRQYVALQTARQRLRVSEQISVSRELTLQTVDRRYRHGVAQTSAVDVRLARENLLSAQASQTALALEVELASHALDVLVGQAPLDRAEQPHELNLAQLVELDDQVIGIPMHMLDRRPDLSAAEFRTIAANQRIGVALADLYPDVTLTGRLGTNTNSLSQFFSLDNLIASVAAEVATAIFQGGRLRAEVAAAEARLQAQAARYNQLILTAIREVEDALAGHRLLDQRIEQIRQQLNEARQAEKLAKQRYSRGIERLLVVLETERRRQSAEDLMLQVEQQRWNTRINLYLAVGGDWLPAQTQHLSQVTP